MPSHPSATRRIAAGVLAACAVSLLGCSPAPQPELTPTPAFASEEEAFAAAEATYRAYNDALNLDRSTNSPGATSHEYLAGNILRAEISSENELAAAGLHVEGPTRILTFNGKTSDVTSPVAIVSSRVCLDIANARAVDASGVDVTVEGRSDIYAVDVTFAGTSDLLLITDYVVSPDAQC